MLTVKLEPFKKPYHYGEAVRGKLTLSLVKGTAEGEFKELCGPMHCKDFIQDAFASELWKKPLSVYGFAWTPGMMDPTAKTFAFCLRYSDSLMAIAAFNILDSFLGEWEKRLGFAPWSKVEWVDEKTLILTFPRGWMEQPIRVSALTLLLRLGHTWDGKRTVLDHLRMVAERKLDASLAFTQDGYYMMQSLDRFQKLWIHKTWEEQTWDQYLTDHHALHHGSGMVSYKRRPTP